MKEKVLAAFAELGFELIPVDDYGYQFEYENINLAYLPTDDDDDFLNICIPGIYDVEEDCPLVFMEVMNKVNSTLKYIKAYAMGESLWLFYERDVMGEEDFPLTISRMIRHLEAAMYFAHKSIAEIKESANRDESDTDDFDNE